MQRRQFIQKSALVAAGSALGLCTGAVTPIKKYKMGLQLFTVHGPITKDVRGTIKQVASIGYQDSETYGYDPSAKRYYGLNAAEFKQLLVENGMTTTSGHYDFTKYFDQSTDSLFRYADQCIEGAIILNQRYITWPWLDPKFRTLEHFKQLTAKLNLLGERITKAGLGFAYHNHDFEFTDHAGENGYEIIMRETDPSLVKLQLDLYWVMHSSKQSPGELINKQPGRFVMWHIKDMDKTTRDYSELGNGSIDYTKILPLAEKAGLHYYYIEQGGNFASNPIQSITDSAAYFKRNLQKFLK